MYLYKLANLEMFFFNFCTIHGEQNAQLTAVKFIFIV